MHIKLFYLTLLIGFNLFGQEIYLHDNSNYSFNKESEELLVFQNDSIFIYDINSFHLLEKKEIITPSNFNFKLHHILNKEPIHFVEFNGGKVYQLNNDSIQRIDNSYTHKMTFQSNVFTYNDTIYRYGGYGYWTYNNKLTFYDTNTNEWQIINSANEIKPKGSSTSFYKILNDKLYIIGGLTENSEDFNQRLNNDEIWSFDFKTKKWEKFGMLNKSVKYNVASFKINDNIYNITKNNIEEIDIKNNQLKIFGIDPQMQKTNKSFYKPFIHKGNIYIWISNDDTYLTKRKIDTLNINLLSEQALVKDNGENIIKLILLIACAFILIFLFHLRKKYKVNSDKLRFKNGNVFFNGNSKKLDTIENKLLVLLIKNDFRIPTDMIQENFYNESLDRSQNIRNINKLILDLNLKLKITLNTENDIIYKVTSSSDKRMKIIVLNRDFIIN